MPSVFHSRPFSFAIKAALTALAFWFVLSGLEAEQLQSLLSTQDKWALIDAVLLLFAQIVLGAVRWRLIVASLVKEGEKALSWAAAFKLYYISVFFNCCLPGTVGGDVIRVWLAKAEHMKLPLAISSVVIDRMISLLALGIIGIVTMPLLSPHIGISAWLLTPPLLVLGLGGLYVLFNIDRIIAKIKRVRVPHWLTHFAESLRFLLTRPKPATYSLFYAVLAHLSYCACAYVLAGSLGVSLSLADAVTLVPWAFLIAMIPLSIGGWGLREAGMVVLLGLAGVPKVAALTLSVQLGLLYIVVSIPAGIFWLFTRKK